MSGGLAATDGFAPGVRAAARDDASRPAILPAAAPPVLLAVADYYGTLAAARALGRAGASVHLAEWRRLVPARWSRFVAGTLRCPDLEARPDDFLEWLLRLGARQPERMVLLPTSDDLAWLFARHRGALGRHFLLDLPPFEAVDTLLNKWRLRRACAAVGVPTPESWLPGDDADLARIGREAPFPLVVKPQTQVLLRPHLKGLLVPGPDGLAARHRAFQASARHHPAVLRHDPRVGRPMLQRFVEPLRGVYGLSGFVGEDGTLCALGSRKVLQRPRRLGIGLCFEEAEVVPEVAAGLSALCRHVGYHGPFEAEYVEEAGRHLLIDFNPRFYGQMAFDVDRGLPLPLLAYLGARGDRAGQRALADAWRARPRAGARRAFCNRMQLGAFLGLSALAGGAPPGELGRWRRWLAGRRGVTTDPVLCPDDRWPAVVEAALMAARHVRHLRSALRIARER